MSYRFPDGVLFGSSKAHKAVRKLMVEECGLQAMVSLPSGVFKPYAGVSTGILFFTKGDTTDKVWFYDMQADGLSLDDKRDPVDECDIPDILEKWANLDPSGENDRTSKAFFVDKDEIVGNDFDLSLNRYKEKCFPIKPLMRECMDNGLMAKRSTRAIFGSNPDTTYTCNSPCCPSMDLNPNFIRLVFFSVGR